MRAEVQLQSQMWITAATTLSRYHKGYVVVRQKSPSQNLCQFVSQNSTASVTHYLPFAVLAMESDE